VNSAVIRFAIYLANGCGDESGRFPNSVMILVWCKSMVVGLRKFFILGLSVQYVWRKKDSSLLGLVVFSQINQFFF